MINKVKIIALMLICISGLLKSQISIKGKVVNSSTNKGVEYAIVQKEGTNIGCICDSVGNFVLNNLKSTPDSLTFTCIGYEKKKIYKNDIDSTGFINIKLIIKALELNEVKVSNSISLKNKQIIGSKRRNWSKSSPLYYASQKMRYFNLSKYPSCINKFSFYIKEITGARKVRIRIYNVDTIQQIPKNDILVNNLIVDNLKKGWNSIDLSKYQVFIPKQGFFIGLESVVIDKDSFKKVGEKQWTSYYNDLVIGCVKELTITAAKHLRIGDQEKSGERKISKDLWHVDKGRGFDLLYRVEIAY